MKVPPKRKGNDDLADKFLLFLFPLNESPSEKEGKFDDPLNDYAPAFSLNESPSEKEGKWYNLALKRVFTHPSMKVPPKRKGNS